MSSGPGLAADFQCDFRAGVQKGLGIYRTEYWVAISVLSGCGSLNTSAPHW